MKYEELWEPLTTVYDSGEAKAITRYLLEIGYGLTMTDILCRKVETLSEEELKAMLNRLLKGEPVQYVTGVAEFGGRRFHVEPGVLIPRPETAELCQWIVSSLHTPHSSLHILDIGTGSGCIACTLAAELPESKVTAWDISDEALRIAQENAQNNHVHINIEKVDILSISHSTLLTPHSSKYNIIVSNPPYICNKEREGMEQNVLDHEPSLALFVPDEDPLLFYRAITRFAKTALQDGGNLYFEINPLYAQPLEQLMQEEGFSDIRFRYDSFGKQRFARGTFYKHPS